MRSPWIKTAVSAISNKKGHDTILIDVGEILGISDHFVITSANNVRQVRALAEEVEAQITQESGPKPVRVEGNKDYKWVLMDYGDFIVHIFESDERDLFFFEKFWSEMPIDIFQ